MKLSSKWYQILHIGFACEANSLFCNGHVANSLKFNELATGEKSPLPKICGTYPTMMNLGTVIPYLKKIPKIYESLDTPPEFCCHQHFFTRNQQILLYQEIHI